MIATDRDALVCDMAETYGVFDLQGLPASVLAALASGLRDNSRIKMKIAGTKISQETLLMAMAVDNLNFLSWSKTEGAKTNSGRPKSIVEALTGNGSGGTSNSETFETGADFDEQWKKLSGGN